MHPADVDPREMRPRRARWFWWQLEVLDLEHRILHRQGNG